MPKFYCDYCDIYLTHSSTGGRRQHSLGRKHINNKIEFYRNLIKDPNFDPPILYDNNFNVIGTLGPHNQQQQPYMMMIVPNKLDVSQAHKYDNKVNRKFGNSYKNIHNKDQHNNQYNNTNNSTYNYNSHINSRHVRK
ncbi:U1 zinc finger domain-containing protein [Cryptosporidium andersoni]|uniref:U1 zinc finger domain-containing protein n=1 Tax=Cryptosporidium andersoni TaxID=117008 RepID=A0A1J4MWX8_9CRYT|nr:U1 zinc finger domain-containing protein [Cryptosporidium andersoni]